ncbi:MAG: HD domain-containing protein, partial [Thermodesulfobacteriota bacterium]|nr:HD domain-containing protein [Thermodesulfobacteriota bacterium]
MISASEELKESRNYLISSLFAGDETETFQENYTEIIDQYFRKNLQESKTGQSLFRDKKPFALVAVGGYGRMELCLHSDIDILFLFQAVIPPRAKDLIEEFLFPLWDLGLDIGHGIRTIKDCIALSRDDFEVLTSIMDARFIGGDSQLFLALMERLKKKVISKKGIALRRWLEDCDRIRMNTYGDASHLLEPNLKEGIGGLRDYHHILWLGRVFFDLRIPRDMEYMGKLSHSEYRELRNQLTFIWLVRNHLHHLSGRRNDRLGFEYQEKIAQNIGFQDQDDFLSVEQFMGKLHACMASIKSLYRSFIVSHLPKRQGPIKNIQSEYISSDLHLYRGEINFHSATAIISNPFLLIDIFKQSSLLGRPLSMEARRLVREFIYLVDDQFRKSEEAVDRFFAMMNGENTFQALDNMLDTGFLDVFIPEFARIRDRVQFDAYHIFPVGRHTLETVRYLKDIAVQNDILLLDIFSDLSNPEPLFLACLLHDIGKVGKGHAQRGIVITRKILKRFDYDENKTKDILFLVGNHLLLVETATRRDLNDEKVVVQCARTIGDIKRLKMLYLLTWADSKATGPRAWNEWISNLVQELFFKILHIL